MPTAYDSIVRSPITRFLVGSERTAMHLHTSLVEKQSAALADLVGGSIEQAQTDIVDWGDVDEATFALFAEYLYTGRYTHPDYKVVETALKEKKKKSKKIVSRWAEEPATEEPAAEPAAAAVPDPISEAMPVVEESLAWEDFKPKVKKSKANVPRPTFNTLSYHLPSLTIAEPRANTCETENYMAVFTGHARLYVLADKYDIGPLRHLTLHELHATLRIYTLYKSRYSDLIELARYTYANTTESAKVDPLRELVALYIASQKHVAASKECLELVKGGGDFATDLLLAIALEKLD